MNPTHVYVTMTWQTFFGHLRAHPVWVHKALSMLKREEL